MSTTESLERDLRRAMNANRVLMRELETIRRHEVDREAIRREVQSLIRRILWAEKGAHSYVGLVTRAQLERILDRI